MLLMYPEAVLAWPLTVANSLKSVCSCGSGVISWAFPMAAANFGLFDDSSLSSNLALAWDNSLCGLSIVCIRMCCVIC